MQFSSEVNWSLIDFVVMGVFMLIIGLGIEFIYKKVKNKNKRLIFISIILLIFLLIWVELAVGILGTPFAGN